MYLLKAYFTVNSLLLEGCSPGKLEAVELNFMASLSAGEPVRTRRRKLHLPVGQQRGKKQWERGDMPEMFGIH